jgi:hypothetical protein
VSNFHIEVKKKRKQNKEEEVGSNKETMLGLILETS